MPENINNNIHIEYDKDYPLAETFQIRQKKLTRNTERGGKCLEVPLVHKM